MCYENFALILYIEIVSVINGGVCHREIRYLYS